MDHKVNILMPENVTILKNSLQGLRKKLEHELKIEISLKYPYKLCDFKPAYGTLFHEELIGYDFWGYCDIDLVFGQIRHFFTEAILNEYDVLSIREDYLAGYLTLFRNDDLINNLYKKSKDYPFVFQIDEHCCFDECNFLFSQLERDPNILNHDSDIDSFTHVVKRFERDGQIKVYMDYHALEGHIGNVKWNNGILTYKNEFEIFLFHFIQFKDDIYLNIPRWKKIPQELFINAYFIGRHRPNSIGGFVSLLYDRCLKNLKRISYEFRYKKTKIKSLLFKQKFNDISYLKSGVYKCNDWVVKISCENNFVILNYSVNNFFDKDIEMNMGDHIDQMKFIRVADDLFIDEKYEILLSTPNKIKGIVNTFILEKRHSWIKKFTSSTIALKGGLRKTLIE